MALILLFGAACPAAAEFVIREARIGQGDLWVAGDVNVPNTPITLDDSFTEMTDGEGRFRFRLAYHPATCTVLLKAGEQIRAVVIENCGQRGPAGPPGPSGATVAVGADSMPGQSASCDGKAAFYAGEKGVNVLVIRSGKILYENPLRPLTTEEIVVFEVSTGGKLATAYGPDPANLLQGGAPRDLETTFGSTIAWDASATKFPERMQIVSESTGQPLTRLDFKECRDRPKQQDVARPRATRPATAAAPRPNSTPEERSKAAQATGEQKAESKPAKPQVERKSTAARTSKPSARAPAPPPKEANDEADPE
jgi:hypothetical protein